jgi:hypothetical protein
MADTGNTERPRGTRVFLARTAAASVLGIAIGLVGAVAWVMWWSSRPSAAHAQTVKDARRAYCLAADNQARFMEVARNLYASARPSATVEQWSSPTGDGFDRVCEALVAMRARALLDPESPSPIGRLLTNPGANVIAGGLLTFVFGRVTARTERRKSLADVLDAAASNYVKSATAYIREKERTAVTAKQPPTTDVDARKTELWYAIQRQPAPSTERVAVLDRLEDVHAKITGEWAGARGDEARALETGVHALRPAVAGLAAGPWHRLSEGLRRTPGGGAA